MENELIKEHHILILGALKRCHVTKYHPMFEDYLQIARWTLIDTHRCFKKEGKPIETFNGYVFQRIYWKITDEIRKEITYSDRLSKEDQDTFFYEIPDAPQEDLLEVKDILSKLSQVLTEQEKIFLEEAYVNELSVTEISRKYNVSRQTVYNWRDKVALKTIHYFKD